MDRDPNAALATVYRLIPLLCLALAPAWAGTYKCRDPDGHVSYQQTPCAGASVGAEVAPDTRRPGGADAPPDPEGSAVADQLEAMERAKRRERQGREGSGERRAASTSKGYDAAACAKHRAQAASWRREIKNGYRDRDEKEQEAQMLKHHEALVERYCAPGT